MEGSGVSLLTGETHRGLSAHGCRGPLIPVEVKGLKWKYMVEVKKKKKAEIYTTQWLKYTKVINLLLLLISIKK